jgi:DNA-binding response OmpR family regulator
LKKTTILIIENYKEIARTFALILQKNGYAAEIAETTAEALEKIQTTRYAAVIIDDEPPIINSAIILQKLNMQKTAKIVITDSPEKAIREGADAYMQKIVKPHELLLITRKALRKKTEVGKQ